MHLFSKTIYMYMHMFQSFVCPFPANGIAALSTLRKTTRHNCSIVDKAVKSQLAKHIFCFGGRHSLRLMLNVLYTK